MLSKGNVAIILRLEVCYRKKISRSKKGSAVRINGNKQKGKKTMEEKRPKRKKKWK